VSLYLHVIRIHNCCYFRFIRDSITCHQTPTGTQYNFVLKVRGCGTLTIQTPNTGVLTVNNPYTLTPGIEYDHR
jgi:hypothetical protein